MSAVMHFEVSHAHGLPDGRMSPILESASRSDRGGASALAPPLSLSRRPSSQRSITGYPSTDSLPGPANARQPVAPISAALNS